MVFAHPQLRRGRELHDHDPARDASGDSESLTVPVTVTDPPPTATIDPAGVPGSGVVGTPITLSALNPSYLFTYKWSVTRGSEATTYASGRARVHLHAGPGGRNLQCNADGQQRGRDGEHAGHVSDHRRQRRRVRVCRSRARNVIHRGGHGACCSPLPCRRTRRSGIAMNGRLRMAGRWSIRPGAGLEYTPEVAGTYSISLVASDQYGEPVGATPQCVSITVTAVAPTAILSVSNPVPCGTEETVVASLSNGSVGSSTEMQAGLHYSFACSNGTPGTALATDYADAGTTPSETFTIPAGEGYTISAAVFDAEGGYQFVQFRGLHRAGLNQGTGTATGERPSVGAIEVESSSGSGSSSTIPIVHGGQRRRDLGGPFGRGLPQRRLGHAGLRLDRRSALGRREHAELRRSGRGRRPQGHLRQRATTASR